MVAEAVTKVNGRGILVVHRQPPTGCLNAFTAEAAESAEGIFLDQPGWGVRAKFAISLSGRRILKGFLSDFCGPLAPPERPMHRLDETTDQIS
jgi:hypothetical protein